MRELRTERLDNVFKARTLKGGERGISLRVSVLCLFHSLNFYVQMSL